MVQTAHSNHLLRRTKITSFQPSLGAADDPFLALCTTEEVQFYDRRYTHVPLFSWAHRRGYDRTLALADVPITAPHSVLLSSQQNRLLVTYGMHTEPRRGIDTLQLYAPRSVPSAVPPQTCAPSPTSPYLVNLDALGWGNDVVCTLEQTLRGALWMRLLRTSPGESWPSLHTSWAPDAHQRARDASDTEDAGPFGDAEMTPVDYRQLYQGACTSDAAGVLGYLGTDDLAAWETSTPSRLDALAHEPPGTAPETLYVDPLTQPGPARQGRPALRWRIGDAHGPDVVCAHRRTGTGRAHLPARPGR